MALSAGTFPRSSTGFSQCSPRTQTWKTKVSLHKITTWRRSPGICTEGGSELTGGHPVAWADGPGWEGNAPWTSRSSSFHLCCFHDKRMNHVKGARTSRRTTWKKTQRGSPFRPTRSLGWRNGQVTSTQRAVTSSHSKAQKG